MHFKGSFILSALTVILVLLLLTSPASVHAAGVTVTPASGTVGISIQISGIDFSGRLASIYWDDQLILSKVPISETGELTVNIEVPPAYKGSHIIKITDDSNWTNSTASATFAVSPKITLFPHIGQPYSPVTVIGSGFASFEKGARVTWDGTLLPTSANADHLGQWSISLDIPTTAKGEHYISAFSNSTNATEIGEQRFIVAPFAKVEPTSGPAGTEIGIKGLGFRTGEDGVTITWDGEIILCNINAGEDGAWNTTLSIPPSTQGHHIIGVYGSSFTPIGIVPDTDFNVAPHIALQPSSGNKRTKVTVNGTGFAKGEAVSLNFGEMALDIKVIADNTGSFSTAFEAPQSAVKDNKIKAMGSAGNSAEATFITEKIAPPAPTPLFPKQGAKLEIYGSVGDVFLGAAKRLVGIIAFRDSRQQGLGSPLASFDWADVKADGKVSYTLQIAPGNEFSSQVLTEEGLVDSEYALSKDDIRAKDSYSWRVKAVDEVGNESPWSEVQEFEVITMSNQTLILSLVIPVLFIGAIGAAGIIIWRKQRTKRQ